ncbi:LuxR family transcriptional regulator [Agrobacterium vitis]|nr:LuxR family transcriptional regulator [Agrobacterium vitis]
MGDDLVHMAMVAEDTASKFATAERYVRELSGYKTQFDVFRLMKRVTDFFGAKGFMVMNVPSAGAKTLTGNSVITNWPADFLSEYDMASLLSSSPIFNRLRNTSIPVVFDINVVARERDPKTVGLATDLFLRFGMPRGACFPVHDAHGNRGAVNICGEMPAFSFVDMVLLHYLAGHVFNRLAEIRELDARVTETLTEREIECLTWTAAGKTSVEIAEIMGLSEHTINHYLNRATRKLDTVNRTQAVAKALRLSLIK